MPISLPGKYFNLTSNADAFINNMYSHWEQSHNSHVVSIIFSDGGKKGDPRPFIPPCVMASSAMGLKLGSLGFCQPHTQKQVCPKSLHAVQHFTRVYLHARIAVDAGDIRT